MKVTFSTINSTFSPVDYFFGINPVGLRQIVNRIAATTATVVVILRLLYYRYFKQIRFKNKQWNDIEIWIL